MTLTQTSTAKRRTRRISAEGAATASNLLESLLGKTPYGNTGSNSHLPPSDVDLTVKIDWLTVILPITTHEDVTQLLHRLSHDFNCEFEQFREKGRYIGRQFHHHARGSRGSLVVWNLPDDSLDDSGSCRISLNASTLDGAEQLASYCFLYDVIHTYDGRCSRCDVALDDFSKTVEPWQVLRAYSEGDYGRFRSMALTTSMKLGLCQGWTIYIGSRQSESMLRYYNKDAESKGKTKSYRWEVELKGQKAEEFASSLCAIPSDELPQLLPQYLGAVVLGQVEFIQRREGVKNLDRCTRLSWWANLIDAVGGSLRLSVQRAKPTLQKSIDHYVRCSGMFLTVLQSLPGPLAEHHFIQSLKREGRRRQKDNHLRILEDARRLVKVGILPDTQPELIGSNL